MKYSEVEKKIKKEGCYFYKDGSNHPIWFSPITGKKFSLSYHKSEEVRFGTLKVLVRIRALSFNSRVKEKILL